MWKSGCDVRGMEERADNCHSGYQGGTSHHRCQVEIDPRHPRRLNGYYVPPPLHLLRAPIRTGAIHTVYLETYFTNVTTMTICLLTINIYGQPKTIMEEVERDVWHWYLLYLLFHTQDGYPYFAHKLAPFLFSGRAIGCSFQLPLKLPLQPPVSPSHESLTISKLVLDVAIDPW